jgi:hypothetical protein
MAGFLARMAGVALAAWMGIASAATYTFTTTNYTILVPVAPNVFNAGMQITGTLVTSAPVAPNLNYVDITALIVSYSFNDGVHTFTSANSFINNALNPGGFSVQTDAAGNITDAAFLIMSPLPPQAINGLVNYIAFGDGYAGYDSMTCSGVVGNPATCNAVLFGATASRARASSLSVVTSSGASAAAIPTLSVWSLMALACLTGLFGMSRLRRHRRLALRPCRDLDISLTRASARAAAPTNPHPSREPRP